MFRKSIATICSFILIFASFMPLSISATTSTSTSSNTNNSIDTNSSINIKDFGAHSIEETGFNDFDSSQAINSAIEYAKNNGINSVDFGRGHYYAKNIDLESNITYYSTQGAELIAAPDIKIWQSIFTATNKKNITIKGLLFNGNWDIVPGSGQSGSLLIALTTCNNVLIEKCCLFENNYAGILMQNSCNYITIKNNRIIDTDCGIASTNAASNNIVIDKNTILGDKIKYSEPISIFNSNEKGLAHDITITNNTVLGKIYATGIFVSNAEKVIIKGNNVYNCDQGIGISISKDLIDDSIIPSKNITITNNNVFNCISGGITAEVSYSSIFDNNIHDIIGSGITLTSIHKDTFSTYNKIYNNNITNINSKVGTNEPAIRLRKSLNCLVKNNTVNDTRIIVNTYWSIQVQGIECNNNIIQNNTDLCPTIQGGRSIYIQNARNTTISNNKGTILDQGVGTIFENNYE